MNSKVEIKYVIVGSVCWSLAFVAAAVYGPDHSQVNETTFFSGASVGALAMGISAAFHGIANRKR